MDDDAIRRSQSFVDAIVRTLEKTEAWQAIAKAALEDILVYGDISEATKKKRDEFILSIEATVKWLGGW